jgi:hypothetical protein
VRTYKQHSGPRRPFRLDYYYIYFLLRLLPDHQRDIISPNSDSMDNNKKCEGVANAQRLGGRSLCHHRMDSLNVGRRAPCHIREPLRSAHISSKKKLHFPFVVVCLVSLLSMTKTILQEPIPLEGDIIDEMFVVDHT